MTKGNLIDPPNSGGHRYLARKGIPHNTDEDDTEPAKGPSNWGGNPSQHRQGRKRKGGRERPPRRRNCRKMPNKGISHSANEKEKENS